MGKGSRVCRRARRKRAVKGRTAKKEGGAPAKGPRAAQRTSIEVVLMSRRDSYKGRAIPIVVSLSPFPPTPTITTQDRFLILHPAPYARSPNQLHPYLYPASHPPPPPSAPNISSLSLPYHRSLAHPLSQNTPIFGLTQRAFPVVSSILSSSHPFRPPSTRRLFEFRLDVLV